MPTKIEISSRTIVFIAVFVGALWLLFQIREIILVLFVAMILASSLNPYVRKLEEKLRFPRWTAILTIYLFALAFLGTLIGLIVPPLVEQTTTLINNLPELLARFRVLGIDEKLITSQLSQLTSLPGNLIKFIVGVFSNLVAIIGLVVITFYLLLERKNLSDYLTLFFGKEKGKEFEIIINEIEGRLGGWVRGQFFLMGSIGLLSFIAYSLIGIEFALPLAILAFLLEIIPNIGPTISAFPAILVGLTISPSHALAVGAACFLIQQIENSILVPRILKEITGVNPLISIISLAIGLKLAGVGGAMLAIPTYLIIETIVLKISKTKKFNES